jgi:hypothetical protein
MAKKDNYQKSISSLTNLRDKLLPMLNSGKVRLLEEFVKGFEGEVV